MTATDGANARFEPSSRYPDPRIGAPTSASSSCGCSAPGWSGWPPGCAPGRGAGAGSATAATCWCQRHSQRSHRALERGSGSSATSGQPAKNGNGNIRDRQGRLMTCEHRSRRVTRTEIRRERHRVDGSVRRQAAELAERRGVHARRSDVVHRSQARDLVVLGGDQRDRITDAAYRIAPGASCSRWSTDWSKPNGLAFSPDERGAVRGGEPRHAAPAASGPMTMRRTASCRTSVWPPMRRVRELSMVSAWMSKATCGAASAAMARVGADLEVLDGVRVFAPDGTAIAHIHLPERCANVCFGRQASQPAVHGGEPFDLRVVCEYAGGGIREAITPGFGLRRSPPAYGRASGPVGGGEREA